MRRVFITINMSAPGWKSWGIRGFRSQGSGFITCIPGAICITQLLHPHPLSRWTPEQFRDQKHCPTWLMTNWALSGAIVSGRNYSASQPASLQVAMQRIWLNHKSNRAFPVHFVSEPDFGFELRLAGWTSQNAHFTGNMVSSTGSDCLKLDKEWGVHLERQAGEDIFLIKCFSFCQLYKFFIRILFKRSEAWTALFH